MSWLKKSSGLSQAIWLSCWLLYIYAFKATLRRTSSFVFVTALVIKLLLWYLCFFFFLSLLFYVNVIRKKKNTFLVYFFSFSCKDFLLLSAETLWSWKSSQWTKVLLWLFSFSFFNMVADLQSYARGQHCPTCPSPADQPEKTATHHNLQATGSCLSSS